MATSSPVVQATRLEGKKGASRIHLTGGSGSGVSTLGRNLSSVLSVPVFDVDDYYWHDTDPPFTTKRAIPERVSLLKPLLSKAQEEKGGWVLSGSLGTWGDELMEAVEHVIFVDTSKEVRMKRLRERESRRYGDRIKEGGDMYKESMEFLAWAEAYEDPNLEEGRSKAKHERWLREVKVPVTRLQGDQKESVVIKDALTALGC